MPPVPWLQPTILHILKKCSNDLNYRTLYKIILSVSKVTYEQFELGTYDYDHDRTKAGFLEMSTQAY